MRTFVLAALGTVALSKTVDWSSSDADLETTTLSQCSKKFQTTSRVVCQQCPQGSYWPMTGARAQHVGGPDDCCDIGGNVWRAAPPTAPTSACAPRARPAATRARRASARASTASPAPTAPPSSSRRASSAPSTASSSPPGAITPPTAAALPTPAAPVADKCDHFANGDCFGYARGSFVTSDCCSACNGGSVTAKYDYFTSGGSFAYAGGSSVPGDCQDPLVQAFSLGH